MSPPNPSPDAETSKTAIDTAIAAVGETVRAAEVVVPVGARTHWEVGGPAPEGTEVRAPVGIVEYDPAELTVTLGAGTTVALLDAVLGASGQHCPLDPRSPDATVGGVLATGLSGHRRLRAGPLRNRLLEVHVVTGDGRRVKGGGRTVKNVSGYDVARLLVGSLGTLGVIVQVTLRCEPLPAAHEWLHVPTPAELALAALFRPSSVLTDGRVTFVLVEGYPDDVAVARRALDARVGIAPPWPSGPHRGRISVRPSAIAAIGAALDDVGARWLAEAGVGTVHVAADDPEVLAAAREIAHGHGGWLLREAGAPALDGFGTALPSGDVMARIRDAFDPRGVCNPGRMPLGETVAA